MSKNVDLDVLMGSTIAEAEDLLQYGVLGMKWGVRRDQRTLDRLAGREASNRRTARKVARSAARVGYVQGQAIRVQEHERLMGRPDSKKAKQAQALARSTRNSLKNSHAGRAALAQNRIAKKDLRRESTKAFTAQFTNTINSAEFSAALMKIDSSNASVEQKKKRTQKLINKAVKDSQRLVRRQYYPDHPAVVASVKIPRIVISGAISAAMVAAGSPFAFIMHGDILDAGTLVHADEDDYILIPLDPDSDFELDFDLLLPDELEHADMYDLDVLMGSTIAEAEDLLQYGVLGMKWGVRRSQSLLDRLAGRIVTTKTKSNDSSGGPDKKNKIFGSKETARASTRTGEGIYTVPKYIGGGGGAGELSEEELLELQKKAIQKARENTPDADSEITDIDKKTGAVTIRYSTRDGKSYTYKHAPDRSIGARAKTTAKEIASFVKDVLSSNEFKQFVNNKKTSAKNKVKSTASSAVSAGDKLLKELKKRLKHDGFTDDEIASLEREGVLAHGIVLAMSDSYLGREIEDDVLAHAGIKGMKWGQRKQEIMSTRAYKTREYELEARAKRIANRHLKAMNEKIAAREAEKKKKEAEAAKKKKEAEAAKKKKDAEKKTSTKKTSTKKTPVKKAPVKKTATKKAAASSSSSTSSTPSTSLIKKLPSSSGSKASKREKIKAPSRKSTRAIRHAGMDDLDILMGSTIAEAEDLLQYGVLGMKWGVRRDQRTLDRLAGREQTKRVAKKTAKVEKRLSGRKWDLELAEAKKSAEKKRKKNASSAIKDRKAARDMRRALDNQELRDRIQRLKDEAEFKRLTNADLHPNSTAVKGILTEAGKKAATRQIENLLNVIIKSKIVDPVERKMALEAKEKAAKLAKEFAKKQKAKTTEDKK